MHWGTVISWDQPTATGVVRTDDTQPSIFLVFRDSRNFKVGEYIGFDIVDGNVVNIRQS